MMVLVQFFIFCGSAAITEALRLAKSENPDCLDFNSDKFPLKVQDLLASSNNDKRTYFDTLKAMGIDNHLSVVGQKLDFSCLKPPAAARSHIFFVGDSTTKGLHMKFLELHNMEVSEQERNQRMALYEAMEDGPDKTENVRKIPEGSEKLFPLRGRKISDVMNGEGDTASYIGWMGEPIMGFLTGATANIDPADTVVFWIGASVHLFQAKRQKLLANWRLRREATLRQLLADVKEKFPNAVVVYDTIQYLDTHLMTANPPKKDAHDFVIADAMHLTQTYAEVDEKICSELGVAYTDRTKLGRYYRGIAADGMHFGIEEFGAEKTYDSFYELVIQSGLARACTKKPANFCKNLDQYDPQSGPNP